MPQSKSTRGVKRNALQSVSPVCKAGQWRLLKAVRVADRSAPENLLSRVDRVIESGIALIYVVGARIVCDVVVGVAGLVRCGIKVEDVLRDRIEMIGGNNVPRKRRTYCLPFHNLCGVGIVNRG